MKKEIKKVNINQIEDVLHSILGVLLSFFKKHVDVVLIVFLILIVVLWVFLSFNYVYKVIMTDPKVSVSVLSVNEKALSDAISDIKNREYLRLNASSDDVKNPFESLDLAGKKSKASSGGVMVPEIESIKPVF